MKSRFMVAPKVSSSSAFVTVTGLRIMGKTIRMDKIRAANIIKACCHVMKVRKHSARGASNTWPVEPAAVAIAKDIDLFLSDEARPTTARITQNPVPAIPKPTRIS